MRSDQPAPSRVRHSLGYGWNDANENHHVEPGEVGLQRLFRRFQLRSDQSKLYRFRQPDLATTSRPPTTDEFIVGVEREILSDLSASFAYTHRSVRNLEFQPLIGTNRSSYEYIGNATGTAVDNGTGFVLNFSEPYYGLTECPAPMRRQGVRKPTGLLERPTAA